MYVCPAEGRCDLPDHRCIWDWIKSEHMQYSFQNVKRKKKKDKENILQDEFNNVKKPFECDPTNKNAGATVWTRWKEYEIFSQSGEKEPRQKTCAKIED